MSFRRRRGDQGRTAGAGVRASPLNGGLVTSSGCASLDAVLAPLGIPLGSIVLVEESGTTDFAGILIKYFAAEGVLHSHSIFVGHLDGESWIRNLPGLADAQSARRSEDEARKEREKLARQMRIAWRYEHQQVQAPAGPEIGNTGDAFTHIYDLTKVLELPGLLKYRVSSRMEALLDDLHEFLQTCAESDTVRIVLPMLMAPGLGQLDPDESIRLVHALRQICDTRHVVCMLTVPSYIYTRDLPMVRVVERLVDAVLELTPFPGGDAQDAPQGLMHIHKMPLSMPLDGTQARTDLAFRQTRRKFSIEDWSLAPLESDQPEPSQSSSIDF